MPQLPTHSYIAGQPLAFTVYFTNGYAVTVTSLAEESINHIVMVSVGRVGYRYLKLDAKLADDKPIALTPTELITCLSLVQAFTAELILFQAERKLRQALNKTL